jgi:hypothetical protein
MENYNFIIIIVLYGCGSLSVAVREKQIGGGGVSNRRLDNNA